MLIYIREICQYINKVSKPDSDREIRIFPDEDIDEWFTRIAKDGKFSTLQVESFERLITEVSDSYSHARYMPEPYSHRNLDTLRINCGRILERIRATANRKEKKKKKPKAAQQALQFMRTATQTAGKQLSVFRQTSRAEEHQKLL